MIIEFLVVSNDTDKSNKEQIYQNVKACLIFQTDEYVSEKSYETISRFVKRMLIQKKVLTNETKMLKRIIKHNSNESVSDECIKETDKQLLMLEQAIEVSTNYAQTLYEQLVDRRNFHMN